MFKLPALPYAYDSLQPAMSETTLRTHHDKHHKAYVDTTNTLVAEKGLADRTLEDVIHQAQSTGDRKLFNQAGQAWNHAFFWECMSPGGSRPSGALSDAIRDGFGGLENLKTRFVEEGVGHFASGWVWLVAEGDSLKVTSTHDADTALVQEGVTL